MPKLHAIAAACMLATMLAGCTTATSQSVAQEWDGHNISEAVTKFGPPSDVVHLPGAKTMYVWKGLYLNGEYQCKKGLIVDSNGIVTGASQYSGAFGCQ